MLLSDVQRVSIEAIRKKLVVEVEYVREEDGAVTCRLMEPFDVGPGRRSRNGEPKFWGWCLTHDRIEQKTISNILSMRITDQQFDPRVRTQHFRSAPQYWIPRSW